ncbi:sigma-54 dependent transcriptional regulator, partial [candidate division KSB1 bacterium]|nr:sigma-54 dependent transcriptional regulator [candidate division KSB1 bacterium]
VVIVDLGANWQPTPEFLNRTKQKKPGQTIIGFDSEQNILIPDGILMGVPEAIKPVPERQPIRQTKKDLLQKIASLVRLAHLQERLRKEWRQSQIVARSQVMQAIMHQLPQLAEVKANVLISGETGTGKELMARAIHYLGSRASGPFVTVDCGAIPENLVENELFGHVRGAYTDAGPATKGLIESADGGTLFLDEVESLPLGVQSRFLRFLQERQIKPLGQSSYISVDLRVIAATNTDLEQLIRKNFFRQDLYYRLNVLPLFIPPLRQRKEDIPALAQYFVQLHCSQNQDGHSLPAEILQRWLGHFWPGNVRELENTVQQWLVTRHSDSASLSHIPETNLTTPLQTLAEVREIALTQCEVTYFKQLMSQTKGNISVAARLANIDRKSLGILLKKRGIDVKQFRD